MNDVGVKCIHFGASFLRRFPSSTAASGSVYSSNGWVDNKHSFIHELRS